MTWRIGECYLIGDCCDDPRGRVHADIVTERGDSVASALRQHASLLRAAPEMYEILDTIVHRVGSKVELDAALLKAEGILDKVVEIDRK